MTTAFIILLIVHGLLHLPGFVQASGLAHLPQLKEPIPAPLGILWLMAAVLFFAAAASLWAWPRYWWWIGVVAIAVSVLAIVPSWSEAKFGLLVNGVVAVGIVFGFLSQGPFSLHNAYDRDRHTAPSMRASDGNVTEANLTHLPAAVQRYLRAAGVVGRPQVYNFRVRMHGRIRGDRHGRWMPLAAEQYSVVRPAARMFYLTASMFGLPVQGYHRYVGSNASMTVKVAALVPVASAAGSEMTQSETVTLFNDMCILAPATLVDPAITWDTVDARTVRARFVNAGHTIHADLQFNTAGELVNFTSEDRYQTSPDGRTLSLVPWSTPVRKYRSFGDVRLASSGEGWWHAPDGEFAYIELTIDDVEYNAGP